jgi:hypothetical protein
MLKRMKVRKLTRSPFGVGMTKSRGFHVRQRHSSDVISGGIHFESVVGRL